MPTPRYVLTQRPAAQVKPGDVLLWTGQFRPAPCAAKVVATERLAAGRVEITTDQGIIVTSDPLLALVRR